MAAPKKTAATHAVDDADRPDEDLEPKDEIGADRAAEGTNSPADVDANFAARYSDPVADPNAAVPQDELSAQVSQLLKLLSPESLANLVNQAVEKKYGSNAATFAPSEMVKAVDVATSEVGAVEKPVKEEGVLKIYRNTRHPNIEIQELDFTQARPQAYPLYGKKILFHNSYFYARTENQVKQLDWMMANDSYGHDGIQQQTIGGNRDIFEDNGKITLDLNDPRVRQLFASGAR